MALQGAGPEAEGKKKFQGAVLKPESNASDFTIYHRTESGEPKPRYSPQHEITTCVVKAIKICQAMLRQQAARDGLTRLAKEYCAAREQRWFLREFPDTPENLMIVVNDFLDLVLARFPNVLVDYSLKNPDFGGGHWRRAFTGDFEISDQFIYLNGPKVSHMLATAIVAKGSIEDRDFADFLFYFSSLLLHEISHVFTTYLSRGQEITPPSSVSHLTGSSKAPQSEAGRDFEFYMFGGRIDHYRDPLTGTPNHGCDTAYIEKPSGFYRITEETRDRTVNCDFKIPYEHSPIVETEKLYTTGEELNVAHPFDHPGWQKALVAPPES